MNKVPVVVLRSNDICFQGILRSFGSIDVPCISVTFDWKGSKPWMSEDSKYFSRNFITANPAENSQKALADLLEIGKVLKKEFGQKLFLIPSSDTNMALIQIGAQELREYFLFIGEKDFSQFRDDVFDKTKTFEVLSTDDLPVPVTNPCRNTSEIDSVLSSMIFPCVYKPSKKDFSQSFYSKHKGLKAISVDNKESLKEQLQEEMSEGFELVVQEKIIFDGPEEEIPFYVYVDKNGKIRMAVSAIKERIDPYPFGTATVLRLNYVEELLEPAQKVVNAMNWRGLLMIEFIKDKKDGKWKVIELNGRPWLLIDFFRRSGFNFLGMLYADHYQGLDSHEAFLRPLWKNLSETPVHFELTSLVKELNIENIESLDRLIKKYEGRRSFYYLEPSDLGPAEKEFASFSNFIDDKNTYFNYLKEVSCEF